MIAETLRSFQLNMEYGRQLLADLGDEQTIPQPVAKMNHPDWIAGHLVLSFERLGRELGLAPWLPGNWKQLFGTGSDPNTDQPDFPSRSDILSALDDSHARIVEALRGMSDEQLQQPLPDERYRPIFPTVANAVLHILTVHTAVHLGQLSAWRRAMGLPPVEDPV